VSKDVFKKSSYAVPAQFPSFYLEEGPRFIAFAKTFYQWMEDEGPTYKSRRLLDYRDVDLTEEEYLKHFVAKYMEGLPVERLGDKRFLQKHILDIYRSKGSIEGLRLLFRFLYGEEIELYIPSRDMIKPSDATWKIPRYLEISYSDSNPGFFQQAITGTSSGATAIVEDYVVRLVKGRPVYVFFLSNIEGDFTLNESVTHSEVDIFDAPVIIGSVGSITNVAGPSDRAIGDKFRALDAFGNGLGLEARANELSSRGDGVVEFELLFGGFGYTLSSQVDVVSGPLLTQDDFPITTENFEYIDVLPGTGATFAITEISNTSLLFYGTTTIQPYDGDLLTDATFLYNQIIITEADNPLLTEASDVIITTGSGATLNDDVFIYDWEDLVSFNAGTITAIATVDDGTGYIDNAVVYVTEAVVVELGIADGLGGYWGEDAVVDALVVVGTNVIVGARVFDSGFGYEDGDEITFYYSENNVLAMEDGAPISTEAGEVLYHGDTDEVTITGTVVLSAVGTGAGDWIDTRGMTNADKYIQDSFYYQEYSYDVGTSRSLDKYEQFIKRVYHPAGVELFGTAIMGGDQLVEPSTLTSEVTQS